jgi:putative transposase
MTHSPPSHHRRSIRLKGYDYTRPGAYFFTLVVDGRDCLFGRVVEGLVQLNRFGEIAQKELQQLPNRLKTVQLNDYIIMPNHVHGILVIAAKNPPGERDRLSIQIAPERRFGAMVPNSVPSVIRSYKSVVTQKVNTLRATPGKDVWQDNYYEHIIRNENEWQKIRDYILWNPIQWQVDPENPVKIIR